MWTLLVTVDRGYLMFSIVYNVVCEPNYCVPPCSLTPTYLEGARIILQRKMILKYYVRCQWRSECWFIFFFFQLDICILVRMDRKCKNNLDRFCYICGNVVHLNCQEKITDFVKKADCDYFGVKVRDQEKLLALHVCCKTCAENLRD